MGLKVVSSYNPNTKPLKVGVSYGMQNTYNPQQGAVSPQKTANPQPQTYNPQKTAPTRYFQPAASPSQITEQAARRFAEEQDRKEAERVATKKRLADAKQVEIGNLKGGFANTLKDKATFGALRRQRGGRELAVKYWEENEREWGSQILARQRNYEKGGREFKDWVMQADTEDEYNKRVSHANWWLEKEYNEITKDIGDYQVTQLELANYAETPLTGKLATAGRFTKDFIGGVGSTSWNALTWTASQPQRAVNTVKNFVNPNNLRQYYGGTEIKNGNDIIGKGSNPFSVGWNQLKKSYNASKDQRIVSYSKADEEERLKRIRANWERRDAKGGKNIFGGSTTRGFLRGTGFDEARVKYGDDVVDMLLDPMNLFAGAGSATKGVKGVSKADRLLGFLGKSKIARNAIISGEVGLQAFKNSKIGRIGKKLGEEFVPRTERARQAIGALSDDLTKTTKEFRAAKDAVYTQFGREKGITNKIKSDFLTKQSAHAQRLIADTDRFRVQAEKLSQDFVKRLNDFNDVEVRALTRYARNGEWGSLDKVRISKYRRADLTKFLDDYQVKAKTLAKSEGLTRRAKNYLPEFTGRGYDPTAKRTLFGDKYYGQGKQQLQESIIMRDFVSNWDESNDYLKQLSATEKAILRNAKKTNRGLTVLEQQQLDTIAQRKKALERVQSKYDSKFNAIRGAMEQTRQNAKPAFRVNLKRGKIDTNFTKQGWKNTAADTFHLPMSIWKKSVLKYNPAWYVNNMAWNVPASVSAAGADVFVEYGKLLTNKKYWNEVRKNVPEGVMSKISQEIGKGGLASNIEDTSRLATFLALKKKGFTDEKAIKQVNRWLFDYGTKNWERPIKGILPFWQWQKNIVRLGTTMPFHSPRSAKVYSEGYKHFYKRPYESLPNEEQEYTDPETGKTVKYNPREFYKGKAKIGNNWYGLPFFAVNPETALNFGTNPYLLAGADYVTSSDRLGNKNTDRRASTILGERFPQVNLARSQANRNNLDTDFWFSQSGNSKSAQGWDKSKSNYKLGLDNNRKFYNSLKSFFGVPRAVKFDQAEFDTKKRLTQFNKDFFAIDWDSRLKKLRAEDEANGYKTNAYDIVKAEQEALAKKYGFDLKKDIYDNYWSKYDTEDTKNTKRLKEEAFAFNSNFWRDYLALPQGSKTKASVRRPFFIGKFDEWKRDHTFAKNPYYDIPEFAEYDKNGTKTGAKKTKNPFVLKREEESSLAKRAEGKRKYQRKLAYEKAQKTGDWSFFEKEGRTRRTGFEQDGKFFKSAESRDKYIAGADKYKKSQLWKQYYELSTSREKQAFLDQHPELRTFKQPTNQAEWDQVRAILRQKRKDKLNSIAGFSNLQENIRSNITRSVRTSFGQSKRLRYK